MKRIILVSIFALVLSITFGSVASAEMPNEGTLSFTNYYAGTFKVIPLDKGRFIITYENMGVRISDTGEGPFHNMSIRNTGVMYFENGVGKLRGYLVGMDKDGDKVITELTEENAQPSPKPTNGTGKIIGGTGKFKGIQGSIEYTTQNFPVVGKGIMQAIDKAKGKYKIVKTMK